MLIIILYQSLTIYNYLHIQRTGQVRTIFVPNYGQIPIPQLFGHQGCNQIGEVRSLHEDFTIPSPNQQALIPQNPNIPHVSVNSTRQFFHLPLAKQYNINLKFLFKQYFFYRTILYIFGYVYRTEHVSQLIIRLAVGMLIPLLYMKNLQITKD